MKTIMKFDGLIMKSLRKHHSKESRPGYLAWVRTDALLVAILVAFTTVPYVAGLGFYNDDWAFLETYENAPGKTLFSLIRAGWNPMESFRPAKIIYQASLFRLFGESPLGYHLTNTMVLALGAALLNILLRKIGFTAGKAFAVALIWGTLPHAATGRFWFAAFQIPASLMLLFAGALSEIQALQAHRPKLLRALALTSVILSGLLYETGLPLILVIPYLVFRRSKGSVLERRDRQWLLSAYPLAIFGLVALKLSTTVRADVQNPVSSIRWIGENIYNFVIPPSLLTSPGINIWRAFNVAFIDLGFHLPEYAVASLRELGFSYAVLVMLIVTIVAFLRLLRNIPEESLTWKAGIFNIGIGLLIFGGGFVVFLTNPFFELTPTGIDNRIVGATSAGVAFVFVGIAESVVALGSYRLKGIIFAGIVAIVLFSSTIVVQRVAVDWIAAWNKQQDILIKIEGRFPKGFAGKTLLLDGVCQYVGPASVFEASWDLEWSLRAHYHDRWLRAEIVTPYLEIRTKDLRNTFYNTEKLYSYGSIVAFRPDENIVMELNSMEDAKRFFGTWDSDRSGGCPAGRIGHGVDVFKK